MESTEFMSCPFCPYGTRHFDALQDHVRKAHPETQAVPGDETSKLDDFELAQLLAFEEAGLPAELALPDRPKGTEPSEIEKEGTPADTPSAGDRYVECSCGERVLFCELDAHSDMHAQESVSLDEADVPAEVEPPPTASHDEDDSGHDHYHSFNVHVSESLRNYDQLQPKTAPSSEKRRIPPWKELFLGYSASRKRTPPHKAESAEKGRITRLGRAELGPYAHERQMPHWLRRMLEEDGKVRITNKIAPNGTLIKVETIVNETPDLVPVLARLSELDKSVVRAFYCSPAVGHVAKRSGEGGFCGYRNIQMLVSYIYLAQAHGHEHFPSRMPSILLLQDLIERAWDMGFNSDGRIETGGIRLTRKYIGTSEAQALFLSLGIPCEANAFSSTKTAKAYEAMLCAVGEYFDDDQTKDEVDKVVITDRPPIYFQHQGHSMTIVGVESRTNGTVNLIVFDPMFNPSAPLKKVAASKRSFWCANPAKLLKAHRRGEGYLSKYREFELLKLDEGSTPEHGRELS